MKKKYYLFALIFSYCMAANAQNYSFSGIASCPEPLYASASFSIGDSMFVVGGVIANAAANPKILTKHVWMYIGHDNSWTQMNDFPGMAVYGASGFAINNYGYVVNGWDSSGTDTGPNALWQYDPANDSWVQKAPFTGSTRYTCGVFTVNNKAYIACGFKPYVNDMYEYDPATNIWTQKGNFAGSARQAMVFFTIGNDAYAGMGVTPGTPIGYTQSDWYKYNAAADTWTRLADFPGDPLSSSFSFVLNNEAYVVNGLTETNLYTTGASNKVWKYTPGTDTWTLWGLFPDTALFEGVSAAMGNAGYMGLGSSNWHTFPITPKMWRFGFGGTNYSCTAGINALAVNNATYNFQATGHFSPQAIISWTFGDGHSATGVSVFHQYAQVGNYHVSLSVIDSSSNCSYDTATDVNVTNISNCTVSVSYTHIDSIYTLIANTGGIGPYTYSWTVNGDTSHIYTSPDPLFFLTADSAYSFCVTVTDSTGCSVSACDTVTYTPAVSQCQTYMYIYPSNTIPGLYYVDVLHAGGNPVSYLWDFGDGTTATGANINHTYSAPGFYTICLSITDDNGCTSSYCDSMFYIYKVGGGPIMHLQYTTQLPTAINDIAPDATLQVYPNPASDQVIINYTGKVNEVSIYNVSGQKVAQVANPAQNRIEVGSLASGIYYIDVKTATGNLKAKFIKQD